MAESPTPPRRTAIGRSARCAGALICGLGLLAAATPEERWFEMRLGGAASGYVHESVEPVERDAVQTTVESEFVVNRLGATTALAEREVSVEDAAGRLRTLHVETRTSKDATTLDVLVRPSELLVTTGAGGRTYQRTLPESRPLLGPEGIRRLTRRWLAAPAEPLRYATFVAELGAVATVVRRISTAADARADVATPRAVEEVVEGAPTPAQLRIDADGRVVAQAEQSPFGLLTLSPSTAAVRAGTRGLTPGSEDLYPGVLVRANIRLPEPAAIERLRVRIDLTRPDAGWPELEGPGQHILERSPGHVVLEITRPAVVNDPPAAAEPGDPLTRANFILQSDHPDVIALAAEIRRPRLGRYAQARLLQDWVATHMQFDPGLALVPASEAVRDRRGTCVGYAVLLASLARSLGIPARIVMGYVYAANAFGGHAWVEILVAGQWIPLDAAVYRPGPADAARIAVVRHSAEHGAASGAGALLHLLGNVSIRIEGYALHGRWVAVAGDAVPFSIDGNDYRNPWLGLTIRKPSHFQFVATDAVYPDPTVVGMRAAQGGEIRLQQLGTPPPRSELAAVLTARGYSGEPGHARIAGHFALSGAAPGRAAVAFRDGTEVWLLEARGVDAVGALEDVAASIRIDGHTSLERGTRPVRNHQHDRVPAAASPRGADAADRPAASPLS